MFSGVYRQRNNNNKKKIHPEEHFQKMYGFAPCGPSGSWIHVNARWNCIIHVNGPWLAGGRRNKKHQ